MSKSMKRKYLVVISSLVLVVAGVSPVSASTPASKLELNPKIGGCYLFSSKEFEAPSPLTNPIPCSRTHNAETFWVAKWPLKLAPSRYTDDLIHSAAEKTCLAQWGFPEEADLNYWAYFFPSKSQWAKGARWLRCDAMVQVAETGTFTQKYLQWKGNAVLSDGFISRNA
jgi:hypothetical protein